MLKYAALALLAQVAIASAQTLPQPNTNGNGPTVVCVTLRTASTVQFNGAPITSPPPTCYNVSDADLPLLYAPFAASCVPPIGPPPCTADQIAVTIADFIHNRLIDRVTQFARDQAAAAAVQSLPPIVVTPAQ